MRRLCVCGEHVRAESSDSVLPDRDRGRSAGEQVRVNHDEIRECCLVFNIETGDRTIGPRSKVWSEKAMVEDAAFEFAEVFQQTFHCAWDFFQYFCSSQTEKMISTAEQIVGPYVWGVYDLLVLPPSFPYGGMENPCLTVVTPTLLVKPKRYCHGCKFLLLLRLLLLSIAGGRSVSCERRCSRNLS